MAIKRLVSREAAELKTYRHAMEEVDILPNGPDKVKAKARADDFRGRVNATRKKPK